MERYMAFYGSVYYPSGGMSDFIGSFTTYTEAKQAINRKAEKDNPNGDKWQYNWCHIYDNKNGGIIWNQ